MWISKMVQASKGTWIRGQAEQHKVKLDPWEASFELSVKTEILVDIIQYEKDYFEAFSSQQALAKAATI